MICIYHNKDLDGYCSGAIVKKKYPEAEMIGYDYGQPFELTTEQMGQPIIMVDVSLPMKTMEKVAQLSNWQLIWIDHHASAIKEYNEFVGEGESFCKAFLKDGEAACEGVWQYLFPGEEMPLAVRLLGEYDTWRNQDALKWDNEILPFQFGMRIICNSEENFPQEILSNTQSAKEFVWKMTDAGVMILKYQASQNERACKSAFEQEFEGLRAICLNGGGFNSDVFKSVYNESKHDVMMPFVFSKDHWTISLYTTKDNIDCSVIAKKMGGGGHRKAAGFQINNISDVFPNINQ